MLKQADSRKGSGGQVVVVVEEDDEDVVVKTKAWPACRSRQHGQGQFGLQDESGGVEQTRVNALPAQTRDEKGTRCGAEKSLASIAFGSR